LIIQHIEKWSDFAHTLEEASKDVSGDAAE
jgi:hypothetical protein